MHIKLGKTNIVHFLLMENSSSEKPAPNPRNYEKEVRNFRRESSLTREVQEDYKREALRKCNDLHTKLLDCYEKKYFCGTAEKEFWDCYRNERVRLSIVLVNSRDSENPRFPDGCTNSTTGRLPTTISARISRRSRIRNFSIVFLLFGCSIHIVGWNALSSNLVLEIECFSVL